MLKLRKLDRELLCTYVKPWWSSVWVWLTGRQTDRRADGSTDWISLAWRYEYVALCITTRCKVLFIRLLGDLVWRVNDSGPFQTSLRGTFFTDSHFFTTLDRGTLLLDFKPHNVTEHAAPRTPRCDSWHDDEWLSGLQSDKRGRCRLMHDRASSDAEMRFPWHRVVQQPL